MQQIQHKADPKSFWKGYEFFHSELYSVNDFDDFKSPFHDIKQRENPTAVSSQEILKVKVKTYSKKKLTPKYEISFEKDFMKEHKAAFQKHYQNYIEYIKVKSLPQKNQSIPKSSFKSENTKNNQSAFDILKTEFVALTIQEKNQFMKDLQHEEKLHEFLNFVVQYCNHSMAGSLISVAQTVWMAYVPLQNRDMKVAKLVQLGQKVAKSDVKCTTGKYFDQTLLQKEEIAEGLLTFLEVFCTTVLLTITGYFANPYFTDDSQQIDGLKRPWNWDISSDQEEESFDSWQSIATYKMRKLSS